jgi:hypothetical protein
MSSDLPEPHAVTTIRDLIDGLTELAGILPEGFETRVELGVCDGKDLQLIEKADLGHWALMPPEGPLIAGRFVLLRGHVHPGERAGELLRGAANDLDQELRELTDATGDPGPDDDQ